MRRRIAVDRLELRVRGEVGDPRALARAVGEALAARLAAADVAGARVETIDAGTFDVDGAPARAADAAATRLRGGRTPTKGGEP